MQITRYILVVLLAVIATGCDNEQSLQEYYVDHKENNDFVMLDVPASLISPQSARLTPDQKEVLQTVKKINILALPLRADTENMYAPEKEKVAGILAQDGYEELMSFGKPSQRLRLYFKGKEDAIDEVVIFALDDQKGFALARVLGDHMNVADMMKLAQSMKQDSTGLKMGQLEGIMDIFKNQ